MAAGIENLVEGEALDLRPERLLLYWTAEPRKADALLAFPYRPELNDEAALAFDGVVTKIQSKDFTIVTPPERKICKECDLRPYCVGRGTIAPEAGES